MSSQPWKIAVVVAIGLLVPLWWSAMVSALSVGALAALGNPERPSGAALWSVVYLPSLVAGVLGGIFVGMFYRASPLRAWAIFTVSWWVATVAFALLLGVAETVPELALSQGTWLFIIGSAIPPLVLHGRKVARDG